MRDTAPIYPADFFDLTDFAHQGLFLPSQPVWTVLDRLPGYLQSLFTGNWTLKDHAGMVNKPLVILNGTVRKDLTIRVSDTDNTIHAFQGDVLLEDAAIIMPGAYLFDDKVMVGPRTVVEPGALIKGPSIIGAGTEVRQGAYLRGDCLVGDKCVVGHTTEVKNAVMLDEAKAGHFAYVGDSILGNNANLGAGTKLANLKIIPGSVSVAVGRKFYNTNRRKLGAILGDNTETGCNSVTSPGTLMQRNSIVYPGVSVPGGFYPEKSYVMPAKGSIETGISQQLKKT